MNQGSQVKDVVSQHYSARPNLNREQRNESQIIHLRSFNNWVKAVLIHEYCRPGFTVLDYSGGKGGDLQKWSKGRIAYLVLSDIAEGSVRHAIQRYNELNYGRPPFPAKFICSDGCNPNLAQAISELNVQFDLVSCQFSLHYSFETEARARHYIGNLSKCLKPGGYFVGTIPNANWIVKKLRSVEGLSFGNDVYEIKFEQRESFPKFGAKYTFFLQDAVDAVPEFLVNKHVLQEICAEFDLELVRWEPFHDFYQTSVKAQENIELLSRMRVFDVPQNNWEVAGVYLVFVFRKRGQGSKPPQHRTGSNPTLREDDFIRVKEGQASEWD
jgi:mRNA (guanine-N7-)-methyltransferase